MKRIVLMALMLVGIVGSASAQYDDMYFVPKKKKKEIKVDGRFVSDQASSSVRQESETTVTLPVEGLEMDDDTYNRRGSYVAEQGDVIIGKEIAVVTEDGDTLVTNPDASSLTRVNSDEGWVNGFEGSDSDYEYAMRIIRFRNPRYAIPVSSPLYWDVVYGGTLWPNWEWNIYDDGMYAYVFPTSSNWYYWDYRMTYPFGWSAWSSPWAYHHGFHWGHHWGNYYAHVWYDPSFGPGWHCGHHHHGHHHGYYPGFGKPGWNYPKAHPNYRSAMAASARRSGQTGNAATRRIDNGSNRNVSSRSTSASGRTETVSRSSSTVRSSKSSSRAAVGDDVIRRSTGSSSVSRSTSNGSSRSNSSYSRPSSTRSSSSSVSRSSSSGGSRSGSYSSGASSSSRSSSYSSGSSSRSNSYGGGGSRSGGSSSRSSGSRR